MSGYFHTTIYRHIYGCIYREIVNMYLQFNCGHRRRENKEFRLEKRPKISKQEGHLEYMKVI
jgi:hypothetical protein